MTKNTKLMLAVLFIIIPSIQYGGYYLLTSMINPDSGYMANELRQNFFRAGHAHAGAWVILSMICQVCVDHARLSGFWEWLVRIGTATAALVLPFGFFFAMWSRHAVEPNQFITMIYTGAAILAISVLTLAFGLLRSAFYRKHD